MTTADKVKAILIIAIMGAAIIGDLFTDNKTATKATATTTNTTQGYDHYHGYNPVKIGESENGIDYEAEYIRKYETPKTVKPAKESSRVEEFMDEIDDYQSKVNDLEETIDDLNAEIDRLNSILDRVTD